MPQKKFVGTPGSRWRHQSQRKGKITMTLTLNPERELTTRAAPDMLQDNELDIVSGGDSRTDPGDDDDKMSGGELAALILLGVGAVKGILY